MSKPLRVTILSRHNLTRAGLTQLIGADPDRAVVLPAGEASGTSRCAVIVYDLAGGEKKEL